MSKINGNDGSIEVGSNAVGELKSWSMSETASTKDTTVMNDTDRSYIGGIADRSGQGAGLLDDTDSTGQGALVVGSIVTLALYPEGNTSGKPEWTGSAVITAFDRTGEMDGVVEFTFSFQGSGAWTKGVVV